MFLIDRFFRARTQRLRDAGLYPPAGQGSLADVERLVRARRKIEAIKLYREIHGVGLKEAKEGVEALMAEIGREGASDAIDP
ncbi:MAG: hypothetical protein GY769_14660 [bacterium]|nr:hypothetical protein [bacterium]